MSKTLVVNLFGGPGVSKSTNTALTFGKLKIAGVNAEIASEYAKDLVWEGRHHALSFQPYIVAKQMWRVHRLFDQVDVILTDSPILLGLVYGKNMDEHWKRHVVDTFDSWNTINFHLTRNLEHHPYNPKGRTQTEAEAQLVDKRIEEILDRNGIDHEIIPVQQGEGTAEHIFTRVMERMGEPS